MANESAGKLSFRAVEVFIAAVEEGSITKAANRLGASASAVSLQLSNLEAALGARLIERSAQRFDLTDAGKLFRQRALRIIDEIDGAKTDLSAKAQSPHMTVRIAIIEDFDAYVLPIWLSKLEDRFLNLRFIVKSGPSHESYSILSSRGADFIVAVDAMDAADWVEEHPLLQDPYLIVMSKTLDPEITNEELLNRPFIRYSREQYMGRQIEAQLRRTRFVPPRKHEFSSNQAILSMVSQSGGWAIMSASTLAETLFMLEPDKHGLRVQQLPIAGFSRTISLYCRRHALNDFPETFAYLLRLSLEEWRRSVLSQILDVSLIAKLGVLGLNDDAELPNEII